MKIPQKTLLKDLLANVEKSMETVKNLQELPLEKLRYKRTDISWSILECLEHLNLYGDFYLPEIKKTIEKAIEAKSRQDAKSTNEIFKSSFFGEMFVNLIQVKNGKIKKMKTVKDKIPESAELNNLTITTFLAQLNVLKLFLETVQYREIDLMKAKTPIALTRLIKFSLGDTFRFMVFHIERHVLQAKNTQL
jgi:hypothetical protein